MQVSPSKPIGNVITSGFDFEKLGPVATSPPFGPVYTKPSLPPVQLSSMVTTSSVYPPVLQM